MKPVKRIISVVFVFATVALAAPGQDFRTDINPALRYYQAMILEPKLNAADNDFLFQSDWRGQKLSERFGDLIKSYHLTTAALRVASHAVAPCDWGIDASAGPETLLPHLARCKQMAVADKLLVIWELQNGQQKDARDDVLGIYALGRNTSYDGTLIGVLVDFATENIAYSAIAENFYAFSPDTLQEISDGFAVVPQGRTVADAMMTGERLVVIGWLDGKLTQWQKETPNDDATIMRKLHELGNFLDDSSKTNQWEKALADAGTPDGLRKMLVEGAAAFQRASDILALPYPEFIENAKKFQSDVDKSGNELVAFSMPAIVRARTKEFRQQIVTAMVRAAIAFRTRGEAGFLSVTDPGGSGPFQTSRFMFNGVDRGFKLTSAFSWEGHPETMIFVERPGTPFNCYGPHAGEPLSK